MIKNASGLQRLISDDFRNDRAKISDRMEKKVKSPHINGAATV